MKIVCINNSDILNGHIELLTKNKTYNALVYKNHQYYIKDNSGEERWYNASRFKDITVIREEKLKQLGI